MQRRCDRARWDSIIHFYARGRCYFVFCPGALVEFRIRGVNTNVPFLAKVLGHPDFLAANDKLHTGFIGDNPQLLAPEGAGATRNRASKLHVEKTNYMAMAIS